MELSDVTAAWAIAALRTATPLLLVLLGELVTQRTGIINLGVEGQMLVGACAGWVSDQPQLCVTATRYMSAKCRKSCQLC